MMILKYIQGTKSAKLAKYEKEEESGAGTSSYFLIYQSMTQRCKDF